MDSLWIFRIIHWLKKIAAFKEDFYNCSITNSKYRSLKLNIERLREETPSTRNEINLNQAALSPPATPVIEEMCSYLKESITRDLTFREAWRPKIAAVKPNIAKLLNASPNEIVLTRTGSEGLNIVTQGLSFEEGDNVVISNLEFHSNVTPWLRLRDQKGIEVRIAEAGDDLLLNPATVEDLVDEKTRVISIVHVVNSIGTIQPAEEIGKIAKKNDTLFMLNASVSCGCIPVDVKRMQCDFLFAPGRKWLRGPDGIGFLYINNNVIEDVVPPFMGYGGAYWLPDEDSYEYLPGAKRYEVGSVYRSVNNLGLSLAVKYALDIGIEEIENRVRKLFSLAYDGLSEIPDVEIYGTSDMNRRTFLAMNIKGSNASLVSSLLRDHRIILEAGDFITLMIPKIIGADAWLRVSPHYFHTEQEIETFVNAVKDIARRYKGTMIPRRLGYVGLEKDAVR